MIISEIALRRPVLATVTSLLIVLVGVMSYARLAVREYPNIDPPVVSVRTVYLGASAEIIESQVTQPLEDQLAGIEGIDVLKSTSREEVSEITVKFRVERDTDAAAADVRDRVARARGNLPESIEEPVISKVEADANPMTWLAFFSDRHSALEIGDFAERYVKDRLQSLPGVATVIVGGARRYAMRIWLDRERLAGYGLTATDVEAALRAQNLEVPSGRIESTQREFTVLTQTDLRTPEDFEALIVRQVNGHPVRLRDVGRAELGAEDERSAVRLNGQPVLEVSYLSRFCDVIIGKNSGPYVFCETYDNYMDKDKTFISFNTKNPAYDTIMETMSNGLSLKCKYTAVPIINNKNLTDQDKINILSAIVNI